MKVLVLEGGTSSERDVSLVTGRAVAGALASCGHEVVEADPWAGGAANGSGSSAEALVAVVGAHAPDVVFVALHGGDGENGSVQALLQMIDVPYTGSGVAASALGMDKTLAKSLFGTRGVPTAREVVIEDGERAAGADVTVHAAAVAALGYPVVVKPNNGGSTIGTTIVHEAAALTAALRDAWAHDHRALVEAFIPGRELTVALLDGEPFPVVEIEPVSGFYDYEAKYTDGGSSYVVPAALEDELAGQLTRHARAAYDVLGCAGVARVDFRLDPERGPFCLEVNTVPGLTPTSLVPKAAAAVGVSFESLCDRMVKLGRVARR